MKFINNFLWYVKHQPRLSLNCTKRAFKHALLMNRNKNYQMKSYDDGWFLVSTDISMNYNAVFNIVDNLNTVCRIVKQRR